LRIALFTDTFFQINGVALVYRRFARWCAGRGVELEIFTPSRSSRPTLRQGSVTVHSVEMISPVRYYRDLSYDALPLRPRISEYVRAGRFDIVHIATQGHIALVALKAATAAGLPRISCYHTKMPEYASSRFLRFFGDNPFGRWAAGLAEERSWWYQRELYASSELVLVPTESARRVIEERTGVPTAIFSRGVDTEAFSPGFRQRAAGDGQIRTLYVGRISVEKNLELLARLGPPGGEGLRLVGDGPAGFGGKLRALLPRARFLGFVEGEALAREYASADIFAFPSKTETFGNAVLEAMASGLPVIVTAEGGPKDFVENGRTGIVADSDSRFVEAHRQLTENGEVRARLGGAARRYAQGCSWDRVFSEQLLGNYRAVIERARKRRSTGQ